ncbi:unnamed protein product [Blepharisma stoltei]|uniref:Uncharacterized protein n=1 Tax=Blepharisma stoltei TaxID=1481888 RepID=A0AAU9IMZ9_9CILI|nr:unnamed protein product [Blepharisma stoltei]
MALFDLAPSFAYRLRSSPKITAYQLWIHFSKWFSKKPALFNFLLIWAFGSPLIELVTKKPRLEREVNSSML